MATTQELLDEVESAIQAIVTGRVAEWEEGNHRIRMQPLSELRKLRNELREDLAAEQGPIFRPIREVDL